MSLCTISDVWSEAVELHDAPSACEDKFVAASDGGKRCQKETISDVLSNNEKSLKGCYSSSEDEPVDELDELRKKYVNNKCLICGFTSVSKTDAGKLKSGMEHMRVHLTMKAYKCNVCDKAFSDKDGLASHSVIHSDKLNFQCRMCGKRFKRDSCRLKHEQSVHLKVPRFTCGICSKAFMFQQSLRKHYRTHTGEKQYFCTECNRGFVKHHTLKTHMHKHEGVKPYKCDVCGKGFYNSEYLIEHAKMHSGDKVECHLCHKTFSFRSNLAQHLKTHSDQRPHKCYECGQMFKLPHHLRQHAATHNGSARSRRSAKKKVVESDVESVDDPEN